MTTLPFDLNDVWSMPVTYTLVRYVFCVLYCGLNGSLFCWFHCIFIMCHKCKWYYYLLVIPLLFMFPLSSFIFQKFPLFSYLFPPCNSGQQFLLPKIAGIWLYCTFFFFVPELSRFPYLGDVVFTSSPEDGAKEGTSYHVQASNMCAVLYMYVLGNFFNY